MRGGAHEPLSRADIDDKFVLNARHGGWPQARIAPALTRAKTLYDDALDFTALEGSLWAHDRKWIRMSEC